MLAAGRMLMAASATLFPTTPQSATTTTTGSASSYAVNLPTGILKGELLLLFVGGAAASGSPTFNTPAGWTQLFQTAPTATIPWACFYKKADGTEGSTVTVSLSAALTNIAGVAYRVRGSIAVPVNATPSTGTATPATFAALAPAWGKRKTLWLAAAFAAGTGSVTIAVPTSYSNQKNANLGTNQPQLSVAQRNNNIASETPGSVALGGGGISRWMSATIAIRPAP